MSIFAKRPEQDQTETALPGEPLRPQTAAELLGEAPPVDVWAPGAATTSVSIDLTAIDVDGAASDGDG